MTTEINTTVETPAAERGLKDYSIACKGSSGGAITAGLLRLTRFGCVFEILGSETELLVSEVLHEFKISAPNREIYSGRAVVRGLVNTGLGTVCEVSLDEDSWQGLEISGETLRSGRIRQEFATVLLDWQKTYRIRPEFKVVMADMQTYLADLRLWLDQVEMGIGPSAPDERESLKNEIVQQLQGEVVPVITGLFDRFESVACEVEDEVRPAHVKFGRRQVHPLLLCSPFVRRTFTKPLGYAGDFEMVNMMFRDPREGDSIFGKMINVYALQLPPILAHRNRITYLCERLVSEGCRVSPLGRPMRVFSLGCGPAHETQHFLAQGKFCDRAHFVFADFDENTLARTKKILGDLKERYGYETKIEMVKRSAHQFIKSSASATQVANLGTFDVIYCAGLFDYLSDKVCRKLTEILYKMLSNDGLLIVTNVDVHPSRNEMEYFLDWHLIHRSATQMLALKPDAAPDQETRLFRDVTGVNVFMELRKTEP